MSEKESNNLRVKLKLLAEDDPWSAESSRISGWGLVRRSHVWRPPTDVLETDEAYVVVVEVAGMRGADISVTYNQRILSIHGIRADTSSRKAYHQMEIAYGEFASEVRIPVPIETSGIEATYNDGFLRVILPKAQSKEVPISDEL
jgi:HSP20 family protein